MEFYAVLTLLDNDFAVINRCGIFKKFIIIQETGASGDNKHYNIVYELKEGVNPTSFHKNSQKFWRLLYTKQFLDSLPTLDFLITNKKCSTPENVIGGYLQKEHNARVVYNCGYDVELCKMIAKDNQDSQPVRCANLYEFIEKKILPFQNTDRPVCADTLASIAFKKLFQNKDLDALRFSKTYNQRLIYKVLASMLGQDISYFDN